MISVIIRHRKSQHFNLTDFFSKGIPLTKQYVSELELTLPNINETLLIIIWTGFFTVCTKQLLFVCCVSVKNICIEKFQGKCFSFVGHW